MKIEEANQLKPDWEKIVAEQGKSGLSQSAYCKQHGLNLAKFGYHRSRIKSQHKNIDPLNGEFKSVKISPSASTLQEIKVTLPNGFQCAFSSGIDTQQVKKLIEILLAC